MQILIKYDERGCEKFWLRIQIRKAYTKTIDQQRRVLTGFHSLQITGNISMMGKIESKMHDEGG